MKIADIEDAARQVINLLSKYHKPADREMVVDPILFAYLSGRYERVSRQHHVYLYGAERPQRIDFRIGGSNPIVIEFAVRPPIGGGVLYGSQNRSELNKLCRVTQTSAKLRALLLIDLSPNPIAKLNLKKSYDPLHAGPGRFKRRSVRVIYVHHNDAYSFSWSPFKPSAKKA